MIDISQLTEKDIGKWVRYTAFKGADHELGKIKSWNDGGIFVVYHCGNEWDKFKNYTAERTPPESLEFGKGDE